MGFTVRVSMLIVNLGGSNRFHKLHCLLWDRHRKKSICSCRNTHTYIYIYMYIAYRERASVEKYISRTLRLFFLMEE